MLLKWVALLWSSDTARHEYFPTVTRCLRGPDHHHLSVMVAVPSLVCSIALQGFMKQLTLNIIFAAYNRILIANKDVDHLFIYSNFALLKLDLCHALLCMLKWVYNQT